MGEVPSLEQIKRLENIQGCDAGVFGLSIFSVIEGFLREKLNGRVADWDSFPAVLEEYYRCYGNGSPKEWKLRHMLKEGHDRTNDVRHHFTKLDTEEVCGFLSLMNNFAVYENMPNQGELQRLMADSLSAWDLRQSPVKTAKELKKANDALIAATAEKNNLAEQVAELEKYQQQYELLKQEFNFESRKLEQEIKNNKAKKDKIDALRQEKNKIEQDYKKARMAIEEELNQLSVAKSYISNLSRMTFYTRTRYDYERSLIRLTKEQESIVNMVNFNKDFLIKGAAGTGKSLVLLKTLEKLLENNKQSLFDGEKTIRLITYTKSLEKYNRYVATLLDIKKSLELEEDGACNQDNAEVDNFNGKIILTSDSYVKKLLKAAFPNINFVYPSVKKDVIIDYSLYKDSPLGGDITAELEQFIFPNCVTREEYCDKVISRTGMKKAQGEANRKKIWDVVQQIFDDCEKSTTQYVAYGVYKLVLMIEKGEYVIPEELKTDYLFVDEAQDLSSGTLRLLRHAVNKSMILAGDNDQSVFQPGFTWSRAGIDVSGTTRTLNINFRSTDQINQVAEEYRARIPGCDKDNRPETFRMGPPVELHQCKKGADAFEQIISVVKMCFDGLGYEPENICIIAPQIKQLEVIQEKLKNELNTVSDFVNHSTFEFDTPGVVRLATPQSCKGLDFPVVLFFIDHRSFFFSSYDDSVADKMNRNMIYTALTRSFEMLHVFMLEECSDGPLGDLKDILLEKRTK